MDKQTAQQHRLKGIHRAMKFEQYPTGRQNMYNRYNKNLINAITEYFNRSINGMTVKEIADRNHLSRSTIYKKLRRYHNHWYNHQYHINSSCSSFLRGYVGSKSKIITTLEDNLPKHFNRYFEIFVGGGSLLFATQPTQAIINDTDQDIMNSYEEVKDQPTKLIKKLKEYHQHWSARQFYYLRKQLNYYKQTDKATRTAQLIYVQATCFYGLLRNKKEATKNYTANYKFRDINFPKIVRIIKADSKYLNNNHVQIFNKDYKQVAKLAKSNDLVYLDPPYDSSENNSGSRHDNSLYYSTEFTSSDQYALYKLCQRLNHNGIKFLETNSDTHYIRNLYQSFNIKPIKQQRNLQEKRSRRYGQLLIKNY